MKARLLWAAAAAFANVGGAITQIATVIADEAQRLLEIAQALEIEALREQAMAKVRAARKGRP